MIKMAVNNLMLQLHNKVRADVLNFSKVSGINIANIAKMAKIQQSNMYTFMAGRSGAVSEESINRLSVVIQGEDYVIKDAINNLHKQAISLMDLIRNKELSINESNQLEEVMLAIGDVVSVENNPVTSKGLRF